MRQFGFGFGFGAANRSASSPSDLSGLAVWYDPANVVLGSGGKTAQLTDLSGNARHATQPTLANQIPYEAAGMNGKPCLHSDAFGQLIFPDLSALTAGHLFAVLKMDADPSPVGTPTDGQIWAIGTGANAYHPYSDGLIYENAMTTTRKDGIAHGSSLAVPHIYEIISRAGEYTILVNGVQIFTTATNAFAMPATAFLLAETSATGSNARARLGDFVLYNAKQSSSAAAALRTQYLGPKYGVATV